MEQHMNQSNINPNARNSLALLAFVALASRVAAQPTAPYTPDANTVVLDHFDGSTVGTVAAYRSVPGCGTQAPAASPNFAYGAGQPGFGQAFTLSPPTGEPDGSATYVTYPGGQLLGQAAGTLEFWVYPTSRGGGSSLVTQAPFFGACAGYTFHMVLDPNGQLQANAHDFGFNMNSGNNRVLLNTWTHVAVTWSALGARLYISGQLVGMDANGRGPSPGYGGSVLVRAGSHVAGSNNRIDELRISNIQRQFGPVEPAQLDIHHFSGITLSGTVGAQYRIEYLPTIGPTNAWQTLTNLILPASPYVLIDYDSPNAARRFYRAVWLP